ncbi:hypothetical protein IMCC3135_07440 [Granulosicoccus antarcticus IMCC3135]|uniref:Uncharacterized protein n=1 Tax=Granulosicoccus antarcticus IMCC3135 TaxID=1192854 RepID=A0A2Z2NWQ5_9GAMM|nr:hypothetical protein IMCC3135_07440 [Granulosicoccus antarcticus IMCC3135]
MRYIAIQGPYTADMGWSQFADIRWSRSYKSRYTQLFYNPKTTPPSPLAKLRRRRPITIK